MITVDPYSAVPVYQQIVEQVRLEVAEGRLKPGDKLEPVRRLADRLAINPSTAARAYQLLEHDGVIETNRRLGSVIARSTDAEELAALRESRLRSIIERPLVEALAHGYDPEEIARAFDLQLVAWRERRSTGRPPGRATAAEERIAPAMTDLTARFSGSHDLALEALWTLARRTQPQMTVNASYVGSLDGLVALLHGEADLAGTHILDEETGEYNLPILRRLFPGQRLCVVALAERQQGLIVRRGNPFGLAAWSDLARPDLRFINRQTGSGTRTLLDYHLRRARIAPQKIIGYGVVAPTHLAVSAAVAEGQADVGLGLFAASRAYNLDFVPLTRERYDLIIPTETRGRQPIEQILNLLGTREFGAAVAQLGGYDISCMGEEVVI